MSLRVSSYPGRSSNPYLDLFYEALASYGVERADGFLLSPRWLLANRNSTDIIHFHWPEWFWSGRYEGSLRALLKLPVILKAAKAFGIKLVWTVHNLDAHEGMGWEDRWGQHALARHCDLLIVHSQITAEGVRERLRPSAPIIVMPHGSYKGYYPEPRPRTEILADLGLKDDRPILCCVGRLRDYKGLDLACEALKKLDGEMHLLIAGVPHRGFDLRPLEEYAEQLPELTLLPRMLEDQEFVDILSVSDAALLPYRQITGSGALLAAWTQGCGVVASDLDFFRELLPTGSDAGVVFRVGDVKALARAIRTFLEIPQDRRADAARKLADRYSWDRCVRPVGGFMQAWQRSPDVTQQTNLKVRGTRG